jgi:hypothetical protein
VGGLWAWLLHWTGADNTSGVIYGFWSGFGSDLGELAIVAGLVGMYRKHTCHVRGCWRLQRRAVAGTEHVVCHKHHPKGEPSHADVLADHKRAQP